MIDTLDEAALADCARGSAARCWPRATTATTRHGALWNGLIDKRPAIIARDAGRRVRRASTAARASPVDQGLPVSVRGRRAQRRRARGRARARLVLDLSRRHARGDGRSAHGCWRQARAARTGRDLDRATAERSGWRPPRGVVSPRPASAGLTLGGGIGWLRRQAWAVDATTSDRSGCRAPPTGELVTAKRDASTPTSSGRCAAAAATSAVVTSFEYRLHPVGPEVMDCFVLYPAADAPARSSHSSTSAWPRLPDELTRRSAFVGRVPARSKPSPRTRTGARSWRSWRRTPGRPPRGEKVGRAVPRTRRRRSSTSAAARPYRDGAGGCSTPDYPGRRALLLEIRNHLDRPRRRTRSSGCSPSAAAAPVGPLDDRRLGSTAARWTASPADGSAFGRAVSRTSIGVEANWEDPAASDANVAWARDTVTALEPYSTGGAYLNFPGFFEEGDELLRASYGERNYERLVELKRRYDPDGLFVGRR